MTNVSIVIITFNEEKNIRRCLESVQGIADEIVVVDSLSTDRTKSICQEFGTRFIEQKFLGYIEQKNFALDQATHDFVLSLDADEAVSGELAASINKIKEQTNVDGYRMNRLTNFCGKWIRHGSWYPDTKLRLFNRKKGRWGGTNPHDRVVMEDEASVSKIKGDILHYSYNSIEELIAQMNHFTSIQAEAMFLQGKKTSSMNLVLNPMVAFISGYFLKAGFLDGKEGLLIARAVSYATLIKYMKLLYLQRNRR
ncbi:MAG: glycosyltransferase family 2 protein [Chitinophagales bacterium]